MVFFFTATGNSLYVAKQLDANSVSIPQVCKQQDLQFADTTIGIVCPVYCGEIPSLVFEFLKKAHFKTPYLYLILTYGMDESDSAEFTARQCEKIGVYFDYIHCVKMVDNYLPAFDMQAETAADKQVDRQLKEVIADITAQKREIPKAEKAGIKLHKRVKIMNRLFPALNNGKALQITENCTGCTVCSQICPLGNIAVDAGRAHRLHKTCAFCLACIQNCPQKAITLRSEKNPNARYRNEHISLEEIIRANKQTEKISD
ncbi:MAG: EFR1 family ferrodoxin [Clostridia bacterium]|nr:EFR1 family ferrodoxin [Clostridia bacterium]